MRLAINLHPWLTMLNVAIAGLALGVAIGVLWLLRTLSTGQHVNALRASRCYQRRKSKPRSNTLINS